MSMLGTLAVMAAVAMVFGACSSEDNLVVEDNGVTTEEPAATQGVTVTVSAGIGDKTDNTGNTDPTPTPTLDGRGVAGAVTRSAEALEAVTRSAVVNGTDAQTGKPTHTLKFTSGDRLYVYKKINNGYVAGMLEMVGEPTNDGKDATFRGELTTSGVLLPATDEDLLTGTTATLIHEGMKSIDDDPDDYDYGFYKGIIYFNDGYAKDLETLMTKRLKVTGEYDNGGYTLAASDRDAIFNCTFTGLKAEEKYELSLQYEREPNTDMVVLFNYSFTTDASGNGTIAFSSMEVGEQSWEINIKEVGIIKLYGPTVGTRELEAGKIYNVRRWWNGTAFASPTNLADITTDHVAQNGEILTGTLGAAHKISIADGATVMLAGVTIDGNTLGGWEPLAGINCVGDATIILADGTTNTVTNFYHNYPCIHVPEGKTLTIRGGSEGTGKLIAENPVSGAGIGGGNDISCGNIVIEGGDIVATGGYFVAGIGAGYNSSCGNITITGGKVTATGGDNAAGIGCGMGNDEQKRSVCGAISIGRGEGFVSVTAIKGEIAERPIGITYSEYSSCGIIKFNGCTIYDGNGNYENIDDGFKYYPNSEIWAGWLQLSITSSDPDNPNKEDVWTLTPCESD